MGTKESNFWHTYSFTIKVVATGKMSPASLGTLIPDSLNCEVQKILKLY